MNDFQKLLLFLSNFLPIDFYNAHILCIKKNYTLYDKSGIEILKNWCNKYFITTRTRGRNHVSHINKHKHVAAHGWRGAIERID